VFRKEPVPLNADQIVLRDRLLKRLELAHQYRRKLERLRSQIGLTAANREVEKLAAKERKLARRILSLPATTRGDLAVKVAIYNLWQGDEPAGESIIRDVKSLIGANDSAPRAFSVKEDPIFTAIDAYRRALSEDVRHTPALEAAERNGDSGASQKAQTLHDAACDAWRRLAEVVPTTIAGTSALLSFVGESDSSWEPKWMKTLHNNLARALPTLAA
jgi:hypothetical protein